METVHPTASSSPASAEPQLTVFIYRGIQTTDLFAYGRRADPVGCARSFPATTPYVILYARVEGVDSAFTFNWELTEPSGEVYARYGFQESPSPGFIWSYSIWQVLPVSATPEEILQQNPGFCGRLVEVGAIPVSQKTGEWRLKVAMRPGFTVTQRFTISRRRAGDQGTRAAWSGLSDGRQRHVGWSGPHAAPPIPRTR